MTDKIKTPEDLLAFLGAKDSARAPLTTKAVNTRMFGLNGTFRDTTYKILNPLPARRDTSDEARSIKHELDYSKTDAARQLVKTDNHYAPKITDLKSGLR
jgi:hypothetical protein